MAQSGGIQLYEQWDGAITDEVLRTTQQINEVFGAASRGAITMRSGVLTGDKVAVPGTDRIPDLSDLDLKANNAASYTAVKQYEQEVVRVAKGSFTSMPVTLADFQGADMARLMGNRILQINDLVLKAKVNSVLAAIGAVGGMTALAGLKSDISGGTGDAAKLSGSALDTAALKLGDNFGDIRAWFMHSGAYAGLLKNTATNTNRLFDWSTYRVGEYNGAPIIVTDSPVLSLTGSKFATLGLVEGAGILLDPNDFRQQTAPDMSKQLQSDQQNINIQFGVGVRNCKYKGVINATPGDTALGTSSNWEPAPAVVDLKDYYGCVIISK